MHGSFGLLFIFILRFDDIIMFVPIHCGSYWCNESFCACVVVHPKMSQYVITFHFAANVT